MMAFGDVYVRAEAMSDFRLRDFFCFDDSAEELPRRRRSTYESSGTL